MPSPDIERSRECRRRAADASEVRKADNFGDKQKEETTIK